MDFVQEIEKRKEQLIEDRNKLIASFEKQMAYYEGAIRELDSILTLNKSMMSGPSPTGEQS